MLRWLLRVLIFFVLISVLLILACIRPVSRKWPTKTRYFRRTVAAMSAALERSSDCVSAPVAFGLGRASITPAVGTPLAGYGARKGKPSLGVHDSLYARALLLSARGCRVCFLTLDALIVPGQVASRVLDSLRARPGLSPSQVVFSATHTHSGPGGWGKGPVQKMFAGHYDQRAVDKLVRGAVQAARKAWRDLAPGAIGYGQFAARPFTANRLVGKAGTVDSIFTFLAVFRGDSLAGVLGTFSPHATVLSAGNFLFSGDWPGAWCRAVEKRLGAFALYAAGGVGSHSPKGPGHGYARAQAIGRALAESVAVAMRKVPRRSRVTLRALRFRLDPGPLQLRISQNIRLASWVGRWLLKPTPVWINAVRIDSLILFTAPADWSGELTNQLRATADSLGALVTVTSFNGGYVGYVVPDKYYGLNEYETRLMSFYGPHTATYLMFLYRTMLRDLLHFDSPVARRSSRVNFAAF